MGPVERRISEKLETVFAPLHMELVNESARHSVPAGSETHFRLVLVSMRFEGLTRVARSREVHQALEAELKNGVHALSQKTLTPGEWQALGQKVDMTSPDCLGGGSQRS